MVLQWKNSGSRARNNFSPFSAANLFFNWLFNWFCRANNMVIDIYICLVTSLAKRALFSAFEIHYCVKFLYFKNDCIFLKIFIVTYVILLQGFDFAHFWNMYKESIVQVYVTQNGIAVNYAYERGDLSDIFTCDVTIDDAIAGGKTNHQSHCVL